MNGKWVKRTGLALLVLGVLAGLAVPTEFMNSKEAFFARFIVIAPVGVFGLLFLALARIIRLLEYGFGVKGCNCKTNGCCTQSSSTPSAADLASTDTKTSETEDLLAGALQNDLLGTEPKTITEAPKSPEKPSKDSKKKPAETTPSTEDAVKTGEIAGRKYRLFADGSLEIDTNQSTIRFDSMEEFRQFIQNPASEASLGDIPKS